MKPLRIGLILLAVLLGGILPFPTGSSHQAERLLDLQTLALERLGAFQQQIDLMQITSELVRSFFLAMADQATRALRSEQDPQAMSWNVMSKLDSITIGITIFQIEGKLSGWQAEQLRFGLFLVDDAVILLFSQLEAAVPVALCAGYYLNGAGDLLVISPQLGLRRDQSWICPILGYQDFDLQECYCHEAIRQDSM
ncbi:MAG: hypothetical protein NUW06_01015 [Candidatus Acetothermia bacterium]|jgi:hypothetical protein|nr:hypothetical protein [Candidatus Acetothermia bacterium]MDH7505659.1 hypothetical protein [Candidatus Acetothermia bacterium]